MTGNKKGRRVAALCVAGAAPIAIGGTCDLCRSIDIIAKALEKFRDIS